MRVLLAIDEAPRSRDAVRMVIGRPWPSETVVRVLTVVEESELDTVLAWHQMGGGSYTLVRGDLQRRAHLLVTNVARALHSRHIKTETLVRQGDPREVIIKEAENWPADLIVVGARDYSPLERWLMGRVAGSLVRHAPCPVQVVRQKTWQ